MGGSPGQPVMFDGSHPITIRVPGASSAIGAPGSTNGIAPADASMIPLSETKSDQQSITLGSDPVAAAAKLKDLMPNSPFVLVRSTTPQGPVYTLGYKPRFTTSLTTIDQRQATYKPEYRLDPETRDVNDAFDQLGEPIDYSKGSGVPAPAGTLPAPAAAPAPIVPPVSSRDVAKRGY
jgi:hypothetical protein